MTNGNLKPNIQESTGNTIWLKPEKKLSLQINPNPDETNIESLTNRNQRTVTRSIIAPGLS